MIPKLRVHLIGCVDLFAADISGSSDPYVELRVGKTKKKSATRKQNLNPFYGETFIFDRIKSTDTLEINVLDWDFLARPDPIGDLKIPLASLPQHLDYVDTFDLDNIKHGKIVLGIQYVGYTKDSSNITPNRRYVIIGGDEGLWRWEDMDSTEWVKGSEVKAEIDNNGKLTGMFKNSFDYCEEWKEITGTLKNNHIEYTEKIFYQKMTNHTNNNFLQGDISDGSFHGKGKCVWHRDWKDMKVVGKECFFRGKVKYTAIPPLFWEKVKDIKYFDTYNCF